MTVKAIIRHNTYSIKSLNHEACQMFKCTQPELIGRSMLDLIASSEMRGLVKLRLNHIREKGDLSEQPLPLRRPDGSVFWASVRTHKISDVLWESTLTYDYEQLDWVES